MKLTTLDYVVRTVLSSLGESTLRNYQRYLQFAVRGFRELNLHNSTHTRIVYLDLLDNKAVNLPADYVKYTKIGVCVNGRVVTLGLDDTLCLNDNVSECGDPLPIAMNNVENPDYQFFNYTTVFLGHYHNGQFNQGVFGMGGGFNSRGYYRENPEKNQIQFSSEVPSTQIVLEYISDGINTDGTASIPIQAAEALVAFVHWKRQEYMRGVDKGQINYAREMWVVEYNKLKHFNLFFTVSEYLDVFRRNVDALPKR